MDFQDLMCVLYGFQGLAFNYLDLFTWNYFIP